MNFGVYTKIRKNNIYNSLNPNVKIMPAHRLRPFQRCRTKICKEKNCKFDKNF